MTKPHPPVSSARSGATPGETPSPTQDFELFAIHAPGGHRGIVGLWAHRWWDRDAVIAKARALGVHVEPDWVEHLYGTFVDAVELGIALWHNDKPTEGCIPITYVDLN